MWWHATGTTGWVEGWSLSQAWEESLVEAVSSWVNSTGYNLLLQGCIEISTTRLYIFVAVVDE